MMELAKFFEEISKFNFVTYYDKKHVYKFQGATGDPVSTTTLIGKYKPYFDKDYMSMKVAQKRGVPQHEVLAEWEEAGRVASEKGTLVHKYAEDYIGNKIFPNPAPKKLKRYLKSFWRQYVYTGRLIPVASEFVIGDRDLMVAGMIDQIFYSPKKDLFHIFDWKTNKKIEKTTKYNSYMKPPISHLPECEFTTYSLQLSLYKYLFMRNTELQFGDNYIVWLNEKNEDYEMIKCNNYEKEVKKILKVVTR